MDKSIQIKFLLLSLFIGIAAICVSGKVVKGENNDLSRLDAIISHVDVLEEARLSPAEYKKVIGQYLAKFEILRKILQMSIFGSTSGPLITPAPVQYSLTVTYSLWVQSPKNESSIPDGLLNAELLLKVPENATVYDVMTIAVQQNPSFVFVAQTSPLYGHFITSIANFPQIVAENKYWMLYQLTSKPDVNNPPTDAQLTPRGVDGMIVSDKAFYLFWLRNVDLVNHDTTTPVVVVP